MKLYEAPMVRTQGSIATVTLASLCVIKSSGGSDNALDQQAAEGPGTQASPVYEANEDGSCFPVNL